MSHVRIYRCFCLELRGYARVPQVAMRRLNINLDVKPVKQQQQRFRPEMMEAIQSKVKKLIDSSFIREEQHPD